RVEGFFTLFVELVVPVGLLAPRRWRHWAGALTVLFQASLIASGNLSFLNWLTIAVALSAFDDSWLSRCLPARWVAGIKRADAPALGRGRRIATILVFALVALLSLNPVMNLLSPRQSMNAGFDPLHLVNTYGAFGSVGRQRYQVEIEGTNDEPALDAS